MLILALIVVAAFGWYVLKPEERKRLRLAASNAVQRGLSAAVRRGRPAWTPFSDALRARTPKVLITPAIVVVNVAVFLGMAMGTGALSDPNTALQWGASAGPVTTHGEWWRLVTMSFVHSGIVPLAVNLIGLIQVGVLLERLTGRLLFSTVYLASGFAASLVMLAEQPIAVVHGAAGAILGLYALLLASAVHGLARRSPFTIPLSAFRDLLPAGAVFGLYTAFWGTLDRGPAYAALATGLVFGLVLARGVSERPCPTRRVAVALTATAVIAGLSAISLRSVADVRPEIQRIVAFEQQTSGDYDHAVGLFTTGRISSRELAQLIDRTIVPELREIQARLSALDGVPPQHQPLVQTAEEYLRLRDESWRLRSEALHRSNMRRLRDADRIERASLEALNRIRSAGQI